MSEDKEKRKRKAQTALFGILNMEKRLPENFDPKKGVAGDKNGKV